MPKCRCIKEGQNVYVGEVINYTIFHVWYDFEFNWSAYFSDFKEYGFKITISSFLWNIWKVIKFIPHNIKMLGLYLYFIFMLFVFDKNKKHIFLKELRYKTYRICGSYSKEEFDEYFIDVMEERKNKLLKLDE